MVIYVGLGNVRMGHPKMNHEITAKQNIVICESRPFWIPLYLTVGFLGNIGWDDWDCATPSNTNSSATNHVKIRFASLIGLLTYLRCFYRFPEIALKD